MCTENNMACPYFDGAVCRITDIPAKDIGSASEIVCLCEHYYVCSAYRNYNEDLIEA